MTLVELTTFAEKAAAEATGKAAPLALSHTPDGDWHAAISALTSAGSTPDAAVTDLIVKLSLQLATLRDEAKAAAKLHTDRAAALETQIAELRKVAAPPVTPRSVRP